MLTAAAPAVAVVQAGSSAKPTQQHIQSDLTAAETLARELKKSVRRLLAESGGGGGGGGALALADRSDADAEPACPEIPTRGGASETPDGRPEQESYDGVSSMFDYHQQEVAYLQHERSRKELEWESRFFEQDSILKLQRDVASEVSLPMLAPLSLRPG